jgi:hypothetical protein
VRQIASPKVAIDDKAVIQTWDAGSPRMVGAFRAHVSKLRFGGLNMAYLNTPLSRRFGRYPPESGLVMLT